MPKILLTPVAPNLRWQKTRKNLCCTTFDLIGLLPTNHMLAYSIMAYRRLQGNSRYQQYKNNSTQNIGNFIVGKWLYKKWQNSANFRRIWYSNLETGRYGPKSGVSRIIRESWQHCFWGQIPPCLSSPIIFGTSNNMLCVESLSLVISSLCISSEKSSFLWKYTSQALFIQLNHKGPKQYFWVHFDLI